MLVSLFSKYSTSRGKKSVLVVRGGQEEGEARTRPGIPNHGCIVPLKKIRDTKGTFHANMGSIKDRNGMNLREAEDIKKRLQEDTELYKKDLHNQVKHHGVITHLEPDILKCEIKWALGSITMNKDSGGDGIPVELFPILKMML